MIKRICFFFFFSSRRRHTRSTRDWSSDVCSSDLHVGRLLGYDIVQAADMPIEAHWVLHHHERIDGRGYPDGLAGKDIPLESRIIHVADAFEAMTSDRPYRAAPGERFAIEELRRNVDTEFDSAVVAALLRVLDHRITAAPERAPTAVPA